MEITCTSRCHLGEVYDVSRYETRYIGPFKITKERDEELKAKFSNFFSDPSKSRGQDSF
jgi:hypothetical protein